MHAHARRGAAATHSGFEAERSNVDKIRRLCEALTAHPRAHFSHCHHYMEHDAENGVRTEQRRCRADRNAHGDAQRLTRARVNGVARPASPVVFVQRFHRLCGRAQNVY